MKKILVTGGAGFIGYHLACYLSSFPYEVTIIDNLSRGMMDEEFKALISKGNIIYINADLTVKDYYGTLADRYDYIYHLAAINGTKYFYEMPQEVLRVNILSLMNLLEWIDKDKCGKFLFTSSSEAYAGTIQSFSDCRSFIPTKEDIPLVIDDVFNPRYSYGGSKLIGELLTINYCRTKAVPFSIVRYHNIYGPRMGFEHVMPEFCRRIYDKETPFDIFGGDETRAFCYVQDGVRATKLVMEASECDGGIFHIGNSLEEIRIEDMAKKLLVIAGCQVPLRINPAPQGCVSRRCPDTSKLNKYTGYMPEINLEKGLRLTYDWYMEAFRKKRS
ncbi:MAG TPA: NAD(P)-dependent oxidoreductase [Candidatus Diapherotrites archaeon]|nr:NAD(P)-dependent oxidoreductase [Candidatus Diapherotrites archaeon]